MQRYIVYLGESPTVDTLAAYVLHTFSLVNLKLTCPEEIETKATFHPDDLSHIAKQRATVVFLNEYPADAKMLRDVFHASKGRCFVFSACPKLQTIAFEAGLYDHNIRTANTVLPDQVSQAGVRMTTSTLVWRSYFTTSPMPPALDCIRLHTLKERSDTCTFALHYFLSHPSTQATVIDILKQLFIEGTMHDQRKALNTAIKAGQTLLTVKQ